MKTLKERNAIRWVLDRDGQFGFLDNGQVLVEMHGVIGVGLCPVRALKEWRKNNDRKIRRSRRNAVLLRG